QVCPYHYEHGEEEWLLVLDGTVDLRTPEGTRPLIAQDVVFFPRGPKGAHSVANSSDATARILMFSNVDTIGVTTYPDSGKVGVWSDAPEGGGMFRRSSSVEYYDGEGTPLVE
ncbi:MAG: Cupin 2 conserved barrel domain protein, partial [Thermoleophilia bacterium]|nr:Cupin 2 conserved barrel domain protein [Thermoleophilia bacterium]